MLSYNRPKIPVPKPPPQGRTKTDGLFEKEMKRPTIVTNSGNVFLIAFKNQAFLSKAVTVMTDIIRDADMEYNHQHQGMYIYR